MHLVGLTGLALCLAISGCSLEPLPDDDGSGENSGGAGAGGEGSGGGGGGSEGNVDGEPAALEGITSAHNNVRAAHGVGPMTWDHDLAAIAQGYADKCIWGHNANRSDNYDGYVGENLYGASFTPTGQDVADSWASEEQYYDYEANSCSGVCGHYTQMVWEASTKLGCGIATGCGGALSNIVVCNYAPGGNFQGERPY